MIIFLYKLWKFTPNKMKKLYCLLALLCIVNASQLRAQSPAAITGYTSVCELSTVILSDATPGGTWSSSDTTIATVGAATGIVTGISFGTAEISYTTGGGTATLTITVNPTPHIT